MGRSGALPGRRCAALLLLAATVNASASSSDLYFGEALYSAHSGNYFEAITRLDVELAQFRRLDEPGLDPFHLQANHAEFSVGDFELMYRMHQRAGRAMRLVLEGKVPQETRNEAAFRLARILYQQGDFAGAFDTIETIKGEFPESIRADERLLRGQIYLANGRFDDAIGIFEGLRSAHGLEGFASYDLGIALLQSGREQEGLRELNRTGLLDSEDHATLAVKDKANLLLGRRFMDGKQPRMAAEHFERVRLNGPFSNNALLASGWADVAAGQFDKALVPWTILSRRNVTDRAVQESLLGVPYAYSKLSMHGKAALLYGGALDRFGTELGKLDASIQSIKQGKLLASLVGDELEQDKNWFVKLRSLPEAPETYYLLDLMASNEFQEAVKNYRDLDDLSRRLAASAVSIASYQELVELRRKYYEPLLPEIDRQFRVLDSRIRLRTEQREHLNARLNSMLIMPRPDFMATAGERVVLEKLATLETRLANADGAEAEKSRARIRRLKGIIAWQVDTQYDRRLTEAYRHLRALDAEVANLNKVYQSFVRTRQAATQSYKGYSEPLTTLARRVASAREGVDRLLARQGHMIEVAAIEELEKRRARLDEYQVQARFALAESYDKATAASGAAPSVSQ